MVFLLAFFDNKYAFFQLFKAIFYRTQVVNKFIITDKIFYISLMYFKSKGS